MKECLRLRFMGIDSDLGMFDSFQTLALKNQIMSLKAANSRVEKVCLWRKAERTP
jgi:hypothetical protein